MFFSRWLKRQAYTDWSPCRPYFRKPLGAGERSARGEALMRKKIKGIWIYRRATEEELEEYDRSMAW